jgi:hypothetical protein
MPEYLPISQEQESFKFIRKTEMKRIALGLSLTLLWCSTSFAQQTRKCITFDKWSLRADAIVERAYITPETNLLEYTTSEEDMSYVFYSSAQLPEGKYRLVVILRMGNSPAPFTVTVAGAQRANGKKEIQYVKRSGERLRINELVLSNESRVNVTIRSRTDVPAKVWSFASTPRVCRA